MKAIIKGKRFDTETAILLGEASSHAGPSDYGWWKANLYCTPRSGAYFVAGEGNANSPYTTNFGNGARGAGERIVPLTDEEALAWAEEHLSAADVERIFADRIEDA
jgi:hypothetical protein